MATDRNQSTRGGKHGPERERKFLVRQLPAGLARHRHESLEQGYLATARGSDDAEVRVRRAGKRYVLTVKKGQGQERLETEVALPPASARMLWPLTAGRRVEKIRYTIPHGGLKIEVDLYRGKLRGLATAEVEFPSAAAMRRFTPPPWFGREVTGVKAFSNSELARNGRKPGRRSDKPPKSAQSRKRPP